TIIGEYIKRISQLHGFYCKNESDYGRNEYYRVKREMIQNLVESKLMARVNQKVASMGLKQGSEEYDQAIQQQTPEDIQDFMDRDYIDVAERVNQILMKNIWKSESLDSEFVEGFKHACITSKEFYHIYTVDNKTKIKNLSPLDVFYHKSPSVKWIADGQYAGFRWLLTPSSIIDLFYDKLSITDMEEIEAMVNPMIAAKGKRQSTSTGAISYDTQTFSDSF